MEFAILPLVADLSFAEKTYEATGDLWRAITGGPRLPAYIERGDQAGHDYHEVANALAG